MWLICEKNEIKTIVNDWNIFYGLSKKIVKQHNAAIKTCRKSPTQMSDNKMNDMPQMPETTGFADLYRETNGHPASSDLAQWCDNWMAVAAVGLACLAVVGAAGYAAYRWCRAVKQE